MNKVLESDIATVVYDKGTKVMTEICFSSFYTDSVYDMNMIPGIEDIDVIDCNVLLDDDDSIIDIDKLILPRHIKSVVAMEGLTLLNPTEVVWPDNAPTIPEYLFSGCELYGISNTENVSVIEKFAFSDTHLSEFTVPKNLKVIPEGCFENDFYLRDVFGLENIERLEKRAFAHCKVDTIKLSAKCSEIGDECFYNCNQLYSISGCDGVKRIGKNAFALTYLETFSWPVGCPRIEEGTFGGCINLSKVSNLNYVFSIGKDAFKESDIREVDLSNSVCAVVEDTAFYCSKLEKFTPGYFTKVSDTALFGTKIPTASSL